MTLRFAGLGPLGASPPTRRVWSHCRFRNRGTEYFSESGIKWMRGRTTRQCDRALRLPAALHLRGLARRGRVEAPKPAGITFISESRSGAPPVIVSKVPHTPRGVPRWVLAAGGRVTLLSHACTTIFHLL
jgi:hypothetical protein